MPADPTAVLAAYLRGLADSSPASVTNVPAARIYGAALAEEAAAMSPPR